MAAIANGDNGLRPFVQCVFPSGAGNPSCRSAWETGAPKGTDRRSRPVRRTNGVGRLHGLPRL